MGCREPLCCAHCRHRPASSLWIGLAPHAKEGGQSSSRFHRDYRLFSCVEAARGTGTDLRNQVGRHRLEVVRSADRTNLYSLRRNALNYRVHYVATALKDLSESKN